MNEITFIEEQLAKLTPFVQEKYAAREGVGVSSKSDANDMLTEVDLAVQAALVDAIKTAFPGDAIIGEESGFDRMPEHLTARCWVIDPIDGTQNFVRGLFPSFGISLGFMKEGDLAAGGIAVPIRNEIYLAVRGGGAHLGGTRLRVSDVNELARARVEIDFSHRGHRAQTLSAFGEVMCAAGQTRTHAAASIGLVSVATADVDAYLHVGLKIWDYAAGLLLVEEAGGRATRLDGSPLAHDRLQTDLAASNGRLHEELLRTVRPVATG